MRRSLCSTWQVLLCARVSHFLLGVPTLILRALCVIVWRSLLPRCISATWYLLLQVLCAGPRTTLRYRWQTDARAVWCVQELVGTVQATRCRGAVRERYPNDAQVLWGASERKVGVLNCCSLRIARVSLVMLVCFLCMLRWCKCCGFCVDLNKYAGTGVVLAVACLVRVL